MAHLCILFPHPHPRGSWRINLPREILWLILEAMWLVLWRQAIRAHRWAQTHCIPWHHRGTGTAIISRWISCVKHTAIRPHRFISGVFHKGTWGGECWFIPGYQHWIHVTGCTGRWGQSYLCHWASLERYFLSFSCQKTTALLELVNVQYILWWTYK